MRLVFRIASLCALLLLAVIYATGSVLKIIYVLNARRAENILQDVRILRVEESTTGDVQRSVRKYGGDECRGCSVSPGCPSPDMSYYVAATNVPLNSLAMRFPRLWFATRPRGVVAEFLLKEGRLCYLDFSVGNYVARHDWPLDVTGIMIPEGVGFPPSSDGTLEAGGKVYKLDAYVTPDAPLEDRQKAFAFDLSCLSRFDGCRTACELLPSAWLDWQTRGYASPEDMNPPWCDKSTARRLVARASTL